MKNKLAIIIGAVAVVAIAIGGYVMMQKPSGGGRLPSYKVDAKKEAAESLAHYVPKNVVAYYSISNIEGMWSDLRTSQFWKDFTALKIWQDAEVAAAMQKMQADFKTNFGFELGEGTIMDLTGKELALAVLPMSAEQPQPSILFLSRVGTKTRVADTIVKMVEKTKGEQKSDIETAKHGSTEIVRIKPAAEGDPDLNYAILGDTLVFGIGNSRKAIENAIDVADGKSKDSLAENEAYRDMIAATTLGKNAVGRFYMDLSNMNAFITSLSALPGGTAVPPNVADAFGVLKMIGGTMVMDDGLYTKIQIVPNREKMDAATRAMWEAKPAKPESLAFVPAGTYLYSSSSSLDVKAMWDLWMANMKAQNEQQAQLITTGIQNFEQAIGINIEQDILSWIGNEAAYVFNEVAKGIFPIPKMAILVKVKNKKSAEAFLQKLVAAVNKQAETLGTAGATPEEQAATPTAAAALAGFKLRIANEDFKGEQLNILDIPLLGRALAPSYAFVGDFLILSSSTEGLQQMIETYKGDRQSLESDPDFQAAAGIMDRKTNQLVYLNSSKMLDAGIEVSNWVMSFQGMQPAAEGAAATNQQFIQDSLIPLLRCLKSVKVMGINTLYTSEGIEQTFYAKFGESK